MLKTDGLGTLLDVQISFRVAGAVQETCSSEMLRGPGADFLREVAFSLARGRQLCTQLSIIEGSLAELLRF